MTARRADCRWRREVAVVRNDFYLATMCGRYTLRRPQRIDPKLLGLDELPPLEPRFNIAPGEDILLVRSRRGVREATLARWGFIPSWANDPKIGNRMVNARADSLAAKPSFRNAWTSRRALVLADGFYEWRTIPGEKRRQPHFVAMQDDEPFAFGAIWEAWRQDAGDGAEVSRPDWVISCAIITTRPNTLIAPLHDRMPLIIAPDDYARWLGDGEPGAQPPADLLQPYSASVMREHAVSMRVNDPRADDEQCIEPLAMESSG
ncbi:MAG TPA: SOS response-associated peptidase [Gemmatimonadaceae bacterium]|nr:SOS response-associated peptidase [Gemmatimonadaceae bacterium]